MFYPKIVGLYPSIRADNPEKEKAFLAYSWQTAATV